MTSIKFNDEIIDVSNNIYYLGHTTIAENEIFYFDMRNNQNKIYNVVDFYPYVMNIYFTNKIKSLQRQLNIQEDNYNFLEKRFKFFTLSIIIIIIISKLLL